MTTSVKRKATTKKTSAKRTTTAARNGRAGRGGVERLPARSDVPARDRWNLESLFPDDDAWETAFKKWEKQMVGFDRFRGKLGKSAAELLACLKFDAEYDRAGERLGTYAHLKTTEDSTDSRYQRMHGRFMSVASRAAQASSYIRPEILAIPAKQLEKFLAEKSLAPWRLAIDRLVRYRPHTLSMEEERLLAMQTEMSQTADHAFHQLHDSDMRFPLVRDEKGRQVELGHGTFSRFLHSPDRNVRREAYEKYYERFAQNKHTLAATLSGSIQKDVYYARARRYEGALAGALFQDNVPPSVYDNLISTVSDHLPALHRYYELRSRVLKIKKFHLYDHYVPLAPETKMRHTWDEAVDVVIESLRPLGSEYVEVLGKGLRGRWCDRYPNQGKCSGAFSCGSFEADPFILMNYQPEVLDHVFTLAHEAGHSMHSFYSARHQPYQYYNYTIFVAEVASTFNEQLLMRHMLDKLKRPADRAVLINRELDGIRGTIYRQTMFAEFEKITHALAESGEPLTLDALTETYRKLLVKYLGPSLVLDDNSPLECLRIPHFYRGFYVYKYATGLSAAIALSDRVSNGGKKELGDYLSFLQGGCSKYPLELLKDAGVDMEQPEPVAAALKRFDVLVSEMDGLL
ncbi:MAG: oligoendopeptidase F [Planctomycetia bacterium]|nr:oligoendopeptidase F [Planctomycetia bacterium]